MIQDGDLARNIDSKKMRHLISIVARALLVADFIDSIGQLLTSQRPIELVRFVPGVDM